MPRVDFDASNAGTVHDARYDGPGRRLATASADRLVRIWSASQGTVCAELRGHRAAVLSVDWAAGRYASLLASGGDDGSVIVWCEAKPQEWQLAHQIHVTGSANVVAFAPPEYGLFLAVAGDDDLGVVTTLSRRESGNPLWKVTSFPAHQGGVSALSWAPAKSPVTMATGPAVGRALALPPCRLASCGADGVVSIWQVDLKTVDWRKQHELTAVEFVGFPRDVDWRPSVGLPCNQVAACTDAGSVAVWVQDMDGQPWRLQSCWQVDGDARRVTWSRNGCLLAVSVGDTGTLLFREGRAGSWDMIGEQ